MYKKFSEAENATETTQYNNCIVYYVILYIIKAFVWYITSSMNKNGNVFLDGDHRRPLWGGEFEMKHERWEAGPIGQEEGWVQRR